MQFARVKLIMVFVFLIVGVVAACTELIDMQPRDLPDLALSYKSSWDVCSATELYHSVTVENVGTAPAGQFEVDLMGTTEIVNGLDVGEQIVFALMDTMYLDVQVDSKFEITESDESNNWLVLFGGTSSRPCFTPTPTPPAP
jgi:subtilase family serine protease